MSSIIPNLVSMYRAMVVQSEHKSPLRHVPHVGNVGQQLRSWSILGLSTGVKEALHTAQALPCSASIASYSA